MAAISVVAGIAAKGQNVAHLVGLGYAVAASANPPALVCTLYWKRCNTSGVVAGVVGGTLLSIGLVLVSPNMSYPLLEKEAASATVLSTAALLQRPMDAEQWAATEVRLAEACAAVARISDSATSVIGLKKPLINLRNPGIVSIPVGFLLVIVFSLLTRSALSESRWTELAVRRETGIGAGEASVH
jgi:cation/acetate symporter